MNRAQAALLANDVPATCSILTALTKEVKAQSGKHISPTVAGSLSDNAARIKTMLGC